MTKDEFIDAYLSKVNIEKLDRAFDARLAYEKNCILKYDDHIHGGPSRPPIEGERMEDFANRFGATVKEMKDCEMQVDKFLQKTSNHLLHGRDLAFKSH